MAFKPTSTRPLYLGALAVLVVVVAFALPPLSGVWRGAAEAGQTSGGGPTTDTTPSTSSTSTTSPPPTSRPSTTQTPTSPPTTRAPVTVPAPTAAPTAPPTSAASSTTESSTTETTVLPELLVPAQPPEADEDGGPPLPTTTTSLPEGEGDEGGLLASTKVWLSVALLAAIGLVLAALTVLYFLHTRPARPTYAYDEDDLADDAVEADPALVGAGRHAASGSPSQATGSSEDHTPTQTPRPMRAVLEDLLADDE